MAEEGEENGMAGMCVMGPKKKKKGRKRPVRATQDLTQAAASEPQA